MNTDDSEYASARSNRALFSSAQGDTSARAGGGGNFSFKIDVKASQR